MAKEGPTESRVLTVLGYAAGIAAVVVALVYVTGGVVLATRLIVHGYPFENVVGQLPRQLLISVGLTQIVLPSIAVASIYAGARYVWGRGRWRKSLWKRVVDAPPRLAFWGGVRKQVETRPFVVAIVSASALVLLGGLRILFFHRTRAPLLFLVVAVAFALFVLRIAVHYRRSLHARYGTTWHSPSPLSRMTALVALAVVPGWVVYAASVPLVPVTVCGPNLPAGVALDGGLIGEATDRIYIASSKRVIEVPLASAQVILGKGGQVECLGLAEPNGSPPGQCRCPAGQRGPPGPTGLTGPSGPRGSTGPGGATGSAGSTGASGVAGAAGATGPSGPRGTSGATGAQGIRGRAGLVGSHGGRGPRGARGPAGRRGPTGPRGPADDG